MFSVLTFTSVVATRGRSMPTGTTMMNFPYYWQDAVKRVVPLIAPVSLFTLSRKKLRHAAAVPL